MIVKAWPSLEVAVIWPFHLGSRLMVYMAGPLLCR